MCLSLISESTVMKDFCFVVRRLLDVRGAFSIWGASIMSAYDRVAVIALVPTIAWAGPRDCMVLGGRVFSRLS